MRMQTIKQGERVAVWNLNGQVRYVDGPRRLWVWRETVQPLQRHSAAADEYLVVRYRDGRAMHLRGPIDAWFDPVEHQSIQVKKALSISAHEAIVVYCSSGDRVTRRIVRGPALFVPTQDEWLHEFSWHGSDPKRRQKVPHALQFHVLRVIPDQMYFDVDDVRTADDALVVVKLMVFFELADIERMLDQTHDPIADFINALAADVIDFVAGLSFEEFKHRTEQLNDLGTYPNLCRRAERIGYSINKVVYRGYSATDKLQHMHDDAIEARTQLKLQAETERQAQDLADLRIEREAQRAAVQRELEVRQTQHQQTLKQMQHEQRLARRRREREQQMELERLTHELELQHARAMDQEKIAFMDGMRGMQVDLTRYLVAQYQNPDRLIRIDGANGSQLHLHE